MIERSSDERGILRIRLADAGGRNALSESMMAELEEALRRAAAQPGGKVLLLSGLPDIFCSGASGELLEKIAEGDWSVSENRLAHLLLTFPLPVVAAMEGAALGGGLTLGLCADIRVASESMRYGFNFTDLGFTPGMGTTALLPDLVGYARGAEMMLTGKLYKGRELELSGLFNHVLPSGQVAGRCLEIAGRLADKPRHVLRLLKEEMSARRAGLWEGARAPEERMHRACFDHPETRRQLRRNFGGARSAHPGEAGTET